MNKKAWLDRVFYDFGRQFTDYWACHTWLDETGEVRFSKWRTYLDAQADPVFVERCNQRTILKNEAVLEFDGGWDDYLKIIDDLKAKCLQFRAYATSAHRAKHIHLLFGANFALLPDRARENKRKALAELYGCDKQVTIDKHMIALENIPHWKTGLVKELIAHAE